LAMCWVLQDFFKLQGKNYIADSKVLPMLAVTDPLTPLVYAEKITSEFGKLQSLDSQLLAKSLISCLAIIGARPEKYPSGRRKNFGPKSSDLGKNIRPRSTNSFYVD
jgi:hypothetical protein